MHKKLIKRFIKDHNNQEKNEVRNDYGNFTAIVGIVSNIILFTIKISLGLLFKSVSILADALNNLVDSISSIITLLGFKLAAKPADKEHPFGHARYESISGLLVGIIVVYVGFEFIKASINRVINPYPVLLSAPLLILLLVSIVIKLWQFGFNNYVGKKIKSNVILATAIDSRNDALITLLVLFGVIVEYFFNIQIDGYIGLILAVFIISSGITMIRKTIADLLGKRPSNEKIKAMEDLLYTYQNILGFHDLIVHQYGHNQYFATVHVEVDSELSLIETHNIIDEIEDDFLKKLRINLVIHQDPVILKDPLRKTYLSVIGAIIHNYNAAYSFHDFRLIKFPGYNKIVFDLVVDQNEERNDKIIKNEIIEKIKEVFQNDKIDIIVDRNYLSTRR